MDCLWPAQVRTPFEKLTRSPKPKPSIIQMIPITLLMMNQMMDTREEKRYSHSLGFQCHAMPLLIHRRRLFSVLPAKDVILPGAGHVTKHES